MKKFFVLALLCVYGVTIGQDNPRLGVKAGMSSTNFSGDVDGDARSSFYVGLTADYQITESFHVQPEFLYSREGAKDASLDYFRVPVLLKYYPAKGFNFVAGPQVGFKVATESDFFDDNTNTFDLGVGFGGGYEAASGFMVDVRYNLGLSNILDIEGAEVKNRGIQLGVGYRF